MMAPAHTALPAPRHHTVTAVDGWQLSVLEFCPPGTAWGCVLMGHAMMVDRRTLCRPDRDTIASRFCAAGLRVLVADARGHGESGPLAHEGGSWGYDELVADTGPLVDFARNIAPDVPLALVGHSLFGHTSLAWLGMHPDAPVDGIVHFACTVWARELERSRIRWGFKSAVLRTTAALATLWGRAPIRALGMGNMDEPLLYWRDFRDMANRGCWSRRDGRPYAQGLPRIELPALIISSEADPLLGNPHDIAAFSAPLGGGRELLPLGRLPSEHALHTIVPNHMALATDPSSAPLWDHASDWLKERLRPDLSDAPIDDTSVETTGGKRP